MQLATDLPHGVTESAFFHRPAAAAAAAADDSRSHPRFEVSGYATVIPCGPRDGARRLLTVALTDLAADGVGFVTSAELGVGGRFVLHLGAAAPRVPWALLCTVTRRRAAGDGRFAIGATFTRALAGPGSAGAPLAGPPLLPVAAVAAAACRQDLAGLNDEEREYLRRLDPTSVRVHATAA